MEYQDMTRRGMSWRGMTRRGTTWSRRASFDGISGHDPAWHDTAWHDLEQARELRVAVRDVAVVLDERRDDAAEREERLVGRARR